MIAFTESIINKLTELILPLTQTLFGVFSNKTMTLYQKRKEQNTSVYEYILSYDCYINVDLLTVSRIFFDIQLNCVLYDFVLSLLFIILFSSMIKFNFIHMINDGYCFRHFKWEDVFVSRSHICLLWIAVCWIDHLLYFSSRFGILFQLMDMLNWSRRVRM